MITRGQRREAQYTDIDVLAIAFDEMFEKRMIVCDCKTGTGASSAERILIVGGLARSLGADTGLFVREEITEHRYIEFADKLNVKLLSSQQLEKLERSSGVDENTYFGLDHLTFTCAIQSQYRS